MLVQLHKRPSLKGAAENVSSNQHNLSMRNRRVCPIAHIVILIQKPRFRMEDRPADARTRYTWSPTGLQEL
jgi:hypothetical protein